MVRSKFYPAVYLVLVFASGILVGAVSSRLYVTSTVTASNTPAPRNMAQYRARFLGEMRQKVGATDTQIAQITTILDEAKHRFDLLHEQEKPLKEKIDQERMESIRAVFNGQQKIAYDQWRADRARVEAAKAEAARLAAKPVDARQKDGGSRQ